MKFAMRKRISLLLVVTLAAVLVVGMSLSIGGVSLAADVAAADGEALSLAQMSDIHYFPLQYCYQDVTNDNYEGSDFYVSTTGDTKLVLESGVILNGAIKQVIADAKAGIAPHYFIATGDLSKNGERVALIDVANTLRYMQNEVRKVSGYEHFQVFAQVGNHDLYNSDGRVYAQTDGSERLADVVTAEHFAMIFAGLGFPNADVQPTEDGLNLTSYLPAEYWSSEYTDGYQASKNDDQLEITYYSPALQAVSAASGDEQKLAKYFEIGDELNMLSYAVNIKNNANFGIFMFDSDDREPTDEGRPVRMSKAEYDALKSRGLTVYVDEDESDGINATPVSAAQIDEAFNSGKAVYRATTVSHITGGRLTEGVVNWAQTMAEQQNAQRNYTLGEKTYIAAFHHNILPHFEQEDDILKDFTLYNWEYTARRFLDIGIRYVFTGHQHSSDIASYTDIEGRTLYDSETGSMVSYESPRRYVTINRYDCGGKLGEQMVSSIYATADMKEIASNHITQDVAWDQSAYDSAIAAYKASPTKENWDAVVNGNPNYLTYIIQYDYMSELDYNEYIGREIYTRLVDRMVSHFLTPDLFDGLVSSLKDMIKNADGTLNMVFNFLGGSNTLAGVADYVLNTLIYNLYPDVDGNGVGDYPYNGKTYNGLRDWLLAVVDDVVNMSFGDENIKSDVNPTNAGKLPLKEMANFIMMAHAAGVDFTEDETFETIDETFTERACGDDHFRYMQPTDKTYRKRMLAALTDADAQLRSGKFADDLFSAILDPLFNNDDSLLRTAFSYSFDFNKAVELNYMTAEDLESWDHALTTINDTLRTTLVKNLLKGFGITLPNDFKLDVDSSNLTLEGLVNQLLPIAKPLVADLIGFNLDGDGIIQIAENALKGYVTDSFKVGLGGIADNIVMAYAFDIFPDLADMTDATKPFTVQPKEGYAYGETKLSYLSSLNVDSTVGADFNAATQLNGRVPSRVTANFDTVQNTTAYTFKFYTAEDVYGSFKFKAADSDEWNVTSTSKAGAANDDYLTSTTTKMFGDVTVKIVTQTKPAYVPLIDLGLLCITHGEINYEDEDGNEIPFKFGERDNSAGNSVIYWNVNTVTVTGLKAGTTYLYDLEGVYAKADGSEIANSFVDYNKTLGYDKDYFTFTTAADEDVEEFSFLTIADIQGMINGMYEDSVAAVKALLADERTNNFNFILNAGDMVDNGKNFNQWSMALDTYQTLFANSSQFFAAGNHEDGKDAFATYFNYTLPTDENGNRLQADITDGAFYSFNYGTAHFIVLNTNDANSNGLGETQLNWLKNDLENNESKWTFVLMHKSLFSAGSHSYDAEVVAMREQLVPLFAEGGVNMVFGGHDHTYTVTNLVDAEGNVSTIKDLSGTRYTGDGVMYITLGTMGTKFYEYRENEDVLANLDKQDSILHTLDSQTFGYVNVGADGITFTGYYYDRESGTLKTIGKQQKLSAEPVFDSRIAYGIIGGAAALVLIVIIIVAVVVSKRKRSAGGYAGGGTSIDSSDFEL